ncbi:MAG: diaminopimelate decarboxylase, partial [Chloroflexi bacterium]|nr:diaminopimelate decarboxylase [Chloroflexota bacterium]
MGDVHPALPESAAIDGDGVLMLGGCRITDLVERFGTPLYVFDRASILERLSTCVTALGPNGSLHYACKAYLATWLLKLLRQAGAGIDVCSSSELAIAIAGGIEPQHIRLHGNNKSGPLLAEAIARCIGAIVVDGLAELQEVISCARGLRLRAPILLRLNPGIEAHTHRYLQTGILDSKFGIPVTTGDARLAVGNALAAPDA